MPKKCTLALVPILAALALPAVAADEQPGSEVSDLLKQMKDLFNFDEEAPGGVLTGPASDEKSRRLSADQSFKEAQDATRSEDWPRASRAANKACANYLSLSILDSGAMREADEQMMKHCTALLTNAAYHLKGGPFYNPK